MSPHAADHTPKKNPSLFCGLLLVPPALIGACAGDWLIPPQQYERGEER